eukprot:366555-Chlamydomonas_euryale.AAC.29
MACTTGVVEEVLESVQDRSCMPYVRVKPQHAPIGSGVHAHWMCVVPSEDIHAVHHAYGMKPLNG